MRQDPHHQNHPPEGAVRMPVRMRICAGCGNFHLVIGTDTYTFSPEQFREFTENINRCAVEYGLSGAGFTDVLKRMCGPEIPLIHLN